MLTCRLIGHRARFWTVGPTMYWECERGCGFSASKTYESESDARRYAAALNRTSDDTGGSRSLISTLPLRLVQLFRRNRRNPED